MRTADPFASRLGILLLRKSGWLQYAATMSLRFIHTADWQIGKPFAGIEDEYKRSLVQRERIAALERIAEAAREHEAEFILAAGDLFDSPTPTQSMVSATCAAIGRMRVPVYAIPGNHDHAGPGSLWEQAFFKEEQSSLAPNFHIATAPMAIPGEKFVIFPCPLLRRAESGDTTAWLRSPEVLDTAGDRVRIVLAHGSVQSFREDLGDEEEFSTATNHIDLGRLDASRLDYVALGDWHGTKQVAAQVWYSGTPEIDRFPKGSENNPGNILAVTVERGGAARVDVLRTGRLGWHRHERTLVEDSDVTTLRAEIESLIGQRAQEDLLRLEISGTLGIHSTTELESLLDTLSARLLRLKYYDRTVLAPSDAEVLALTQRAGDPLIASVARQLVARATAGDDVARIALRELHAHCPTP